MTEPGATTVPGANQVHGPTWASSPIVTCSAEVALTCALAPTMQSTRCVARPYLGAGGHPRVPLQDRPGEKGDVFCQLDGRVQVGVLWVEHGDARAHPLLIDARPQHCFGGSQLDRSLTPLASTGSGDTIEITGYPASCSTAMTSVR